MLTAKQHEAYQFIRRYILQNGFAPTEAEIANGMGITSRGVVHRYVTALSNEGMVKITPNKRRNIELTASHHDQKGLPILGAIAAGSPIEAIASGKYLNLEHVFGRTSRFLLKVKGNSMIGDNICDGDYIICEHRNKFTRNEILVLLIDHQDVTLKRIQANQDSTVTLIPSNPALKPSSYSADRVQIQGVYIGLLRFDISPV